MYIFQILITESSICTVYRSNMRVCLMLLILPPLVRPEFHAASLPSRPAPARGETISCHAKVVNIRARFDKV